jgi:predicted AlkP superfamily phosphohydrolase/phosphomutase
LEAARDELYVAADRAVARILESAPSDALVLVFSLHGMAANPGWADRSADLVRHVHRDGSQAAPREGRLYRWKRRVPWRLIREVTTRLPVRVNKRFVPLWSSRMFDWSRTRFFPLPVDINGYIRVNLKGREPRGIVEPGAEYDALLTELEDAFRGYRTIETGEPIVRDVVRVDDIVDAGAPRRYLLPDIVLLWAPVSMQEVSGVVSERYGELRWGKGAPLPSGRSGNHLPDGWLVACGAGIEKGPDLTCDSIDLVPTIYSWLGAEPSPSFQGRLIEEIVPTVR